MRVTGIQRAQGYVNRRGRVIDTGPWYSRYGLADSGIHATPADLAVFLRSLFSSETLLTEVMRGQMTRVPAVGHPPAEYGMGIYVLRDPWGAGCTWYSHDGIDPGYQADMMYLPVLDLTIVLAANASLGRADDAYERLLVSVVQAALGSFQSLGAKHSGLE